MMLLLLLNHSLRHLCGKINVTFHFLFLGLTELYCGVGGAFLVGFEAIEVSFLLST
jgi:hypothetical protein